MRLKFQPTLDYAKDTGLVLILIFLLMAYWREDPFFVLITIVTLVADMTVPVIFKPLAILWYYIAKFLGQITNRIILTLIFTLVLLPVGLFRKALGYDPMKRKEWKKGTGSVFRTRDHLFTSGDLSMPY
jgi:hypothetical protein